MRNQGSTRFGCRLQTDEKPTVAMSSSPLVKRVSKQGVLNQKLDLLSRQLSKAIIEAAVAHGDINLAGKSDSEIRQEVADFLLDVAKNRKMLVAIDHTSTIKDIGRQFEKDGKPELASMMYATWVEHLLNGMISMAVHRKGQGDKLSK